MIVAWIEAHALLDGGAVVLVLALAWSLVARRRRLPPPREYRDVLSQGASPAQRNTALIDAPPAAPQVVPSVPVLADTPALDGDDLTRIKGLGPKLRRVLADIGVTRFEQIAAWTEADLVAIDAQLGAFAGRPARDAWVEQAQLLVSGDAAAYEAKFGKL